MLQLDEGFQFGLGVFTTIAVENRHAILLEKHLERLQKSQDFFGFTHSITASLVEDYIKAQALEKAAVKIMLSEKNILITHRENPYTLEHFRAGFRLNISGVYRNETAQLTYHKSLNYGENILEKQKSIKMGYHEPIFLNSKGQIAEGATTNIFFIKGDKIYTPETSCGLLAGVVRAYLLEQYSIEEASIYPHKLEIFDECFVTNALMGVMPVASIGNQAFTKREQTKKISTDYQRAWGLSPNF